MKFVVLHKKGLPARPHVGHWGAEAVARAWRGCFPLHRVKRSSSRTKVTSVALALAILAGHSMAFAQEARIVALTKVNVGQGGRVQAAFDSAISAALRSAGVRVIDLDAALAGQRFAFAERVQQGKLPDELTVLNADVVGSFQLDCSQASAAVMGSKVQAYNCVMSSKVIRVDSGDVVFADSQSFTGHGLNPQMALQAVFDKRLPPAVQEDTRSWLSQLEASGAWSLDLVVEGVNDRTVARGIAVALQGMPGVSGARLVVYRQGLAKFVLSGEGQAALEQLPTVMEQCEGAPLQVTYQTARVLHADFDFGKAYRRNTMALSVVGSGGDGSGAPDVVQAALGNLTYLQLAHTRPWLSTEAKRPAAEQRLRAQARQRNIPLYAVVTVGAQEKSWLSTATLVSSVSGQPIASASGHGQSLVTAIDEAVHALDARYRAALGKAEVRKTLAMDDAAAELGKGNELVVTSFSAPTPKAPKSEATLTLVNASSHPISDITVDLSNDERAIAKRAVTTIAPGAELLLPVPVDPKLLGEQDYMQLTAVIRYRLGDSYGKASVYAPWVRSNDGTGGGLLGQEAGAPRAYLETVELAVARFNAGEWVEARKLLQRSHTLFPNARTLRALGMVEFDLGNYAQAASLFQQALDEKKRALTPRMRASVLQWLQQARAQS